jgi:hypothetical protein
MIEAAHAVSQEKAARRSTTPMRPNSHACPFRDAAEAPFMPPALMQRARHQSRADVRFGQAF